MSTSTVATTCSSATNALFRSSCKAIDDRFTALGWTRTSDTSQIDFTTVVTPTFGNYAGYSMWKMADTLQATAPCFVKIEYTVGGGTNTVGIRVTVGQGSDGAGNISGVQLSSFPMMATTTARATADNNTYASGSTNRFNMIAFYDGTTGNGIMLSIERSKDASGNDTGDAILVAWGVVNSATSSQVLVCGNGGATLQSTASAPVPTSGNNFTFGTDVGLGGINYFSGHRYNDGMNLLAYLVADFTGGITISVPIYGSSHTYRTIGDRGPYCNGTSACLLAMRYE